MIVHPDYRQPEDLSLEGLKRLKQVWCIEGWEKGDIQAAITVGRVLGVNQQAHYGPKYVWEYGDLKVYVDDYPGGKTMSISVGGKTVVVSPTSVHADHRPSLFVPGPWIDIIREAELLAQEVLEKRRTQAEQDERQKLLHELGLG